jgi:hypothetical protein
VAATTYAYTTSMYVSRICFTSLKSHVFGTTLDYVKIHLLLLKITITVIIVVVIVLSRKTVFVNTEYMGAQHIDHMYSQITDRPHVFPDSPILPAESRILKPLLFSVQIFNCP